VGVPTPTLNDEKAFDKFRDLTAKIMAVPKSKIDAREAKYRQARKVKNRKRHR
jgi:hypothetical protein